MPDRPVVRLRALARHVAGGAATLLLVSVAVFAGMRAVPGRYEQIVLGPFATEQARANLREQFGLDQPVPVQYLRWVGALLRGDLGTSLTSRQPIAGEIGARFSVNVELTLVAVLVALAVGLPLGVAAAVGARRRVVPGAARVAGALGVSVPDFVLALLALLVFSSLPLGLDVTGWTPLQDGLVPNLRSVAVPALVLATFLTSVTIRTTRDAVLGVLTEPHVTAAVARGESPGHVLRHHVARNASVPVVTVVLTATAYALGGSVLIEKIFTVPGLGNYLLGAVGSRDYGVVQAVTLVAATVFVVVNVLGDELTAWLDPRIAARRPA